MKVKNFMKYFKIQRRGLEIFQNFHEIFKYFHEIFKYFKVKYFTVHP